MRIKLNASTRLLAVEEQDKIEDDNDASTFVKDELGIAEAEVVAPPKSFKDENDNALEENRDEIRDRNTPDDPADDEEISTDTKPKEARLAAALRRHLRP